VEMKDKKLKEAGMEGKGRIELGGVLSKDDVNRRQCSGGSETKPNQPGQTKPDQTKRSGDQRFTVPKVRQNSTGIPRY
jgi:hypothetical protein